MKKMIAVALLAVPLTFAQSTPAQGDQTTTTTKGKKHHGKKGKKQQTDNTSSSAPAK